MEQKLYLSAPCLSSDVEIMINKPLAKVYTFKNYIQNIMVMMKYYELKKNKYEKKYNKSQLIKNLVNSTDDLKIMGTTFVTFVTLSLTGVGIIVDPIAAGAGCATSIFVKICCSWLKKYGPRYIKKYTCIPKTIDNFRHLHVTSPIYNHIDEKEYHHIVKTYENYFNNTLTSPIQQSWLRIIQIKSQTVFNNILFYFKRRKKIKINFPYLKKYVVFLNSFFFNKEMDNFSICKSEYRKSFKSDHLKSVKHLEKLDRFYFKKL